MTDIYLFDWGNTLMVDDPTEVGKMRDWQEIQAIDGAEELLCRLSESTKVYVATNAEDSQEQDIKAAFSRAGLDQYISGYFCRSNLGVDKGSPHYFPSIVDRLQATAENITMVGDSYSTDIKPALCAGLKAIWLTPSAQSITQRRLKNVQSLHEI